MDITNTELAAEATVSETVYVVSGFMRSGTSMMMKCLEAGGMQAAYNPRKDRVLNSKYARESYHPNPQGFYELGPREFQHPDFPKIYAGKLIKVLHWRLAGLPPFKYKIIFMLRDPLEIEVSYLRMFQRRPPFILYKYHQFTSEIINKLTAKTDTFVITVQYKDVINDSVAVFADIKASNFPVTDIQKAAAAVNPALYRSRGRDLIQARRAIDGLRTDLPEILKTQLSELVPNGAKRII